MKEKKELGLKYKILTSETAFFGKIKSSTKSTEESETVQCSVMSAQDFSLSSHQRSQVRFSMKDSKVSYDCVLSER